MPSAVVPPGAGVNVPLPVDGNASMTYLARVLIRRILTALALITGLAATGAPASAAVADVVSEQLAEASAKHTGQQAACECVYERGLDPMRQKPRIKCAAVPAPVTIFIPTVQLRADRALE